MNKIVKQVMDREQLLEKKGFRVRASRKFVINAARIGREKVLEIGTGKGFLTRELAREKCDLTTVDIDRKVQKAAKALIRYYALEDRVTFRVMDSVRLKYRDEAFDTVISMDLFHHLRAPIRALREMARVTRRKVVIADFNGSGADLMERIHAAEGRAHARTKVSFVRIRQVLRQKGFKVKTYRKKLHTVLVAEKG